MDSCVKSEILSYMKKSGIMPLVDDCSAVIVGFSGGADSVFLLSFLSELLSDKIVSAAHLNHSLRGAESDRDNDFCRDFCAERGILFFEKKCDVASISEEQGIGTEECARNVRYLFFDECRNRLSEELKIDKCKILVATAHNADDNLETFIFNSVRGSAAKGLCAIPPVRDGVYIRPILCLSSAFIRDYLKNHGVEYVVDSTNEENDYTRNRIRHLIVPELRKINPSAERSVERLSSSLRRDELYLQNETRKAMGEYYGENKIPADILREMDPAISSRAVVELFRAASDAELSGVHIESVMDAVMGGSACELHLPGSVTAFIGDEIVFKRVFEKNPPKTEPFCRELKLGENRFDDLDFVLVLRDINDTYNGKKPNIYNSLINVALNNDKITGDIFVRNRRCSDEYFFSGHHRKLKKLMCDRKIPRAERDRIPIICDGAGILWVPGFPPRDGVKAVPGDKSSISISYFDTKEKEGQ